MTKRLQDLCLNLISCLEWYIEEDDIQDWDGWEVENAYWIEGKNNAIRSVGEAKAALSELSDSKTAETLRSKLIQCGWVTNFNADTLVSLIEKHYKLYNGYMTDTGYLETPDSSSIDTTP